MRAADRNFVKNVYRFKSKVSAASVAAFCRNAFRRKMTSFYCSQ